MIVLSLLIGILVAFFLVMNLVLTIDHIDKEPIYVFRTIANILLVVVHIPYVVFLAATVAEKLK